MADTDDLSIWDRVTVTYDTVRSPNDAIVRKLPPFTQTTVGEEETFTDKVLVEYPNTLNTGLMANMREKVDPEQIE